jgi:pre-rRNA-processing protein TSR4
MASYDDDSSDEELSEFSTTNVLLGYASKETTEDAISQLGGRPVCMLQP